MNRKINIGIVAHVDAGKTTVTEQLLYHSGAIKAVGRVDKGNTQTDSMEQEQKRGISIKAATTSITWRDMKINIIDTPGHVDFISEVERSLSILDGAILVISAKEGIQTQTKILFDTLRNLKIPTIIFINKIDRLGNDCTMLYKSLKTILSNKVVGIQGVYNEGTKEVQLLELFHDSVIEDVINTLGGFDEEIVSLFLKNGQLSKGLLEEKLVYHAKRAEAFPVLYGSALLNIGIEALLDAITVYLPSNNHEGVAEALSGVVFKIEGGIGTNKKIYIRLFKGKISLRDIVEIPEKNIRGKITKILAIKNGRQLEVKSISSGDIAIIYGIKNLQIGDVLGVASEDIRKVSLAKPFLQTRVTPLLEGEKLRLFKVLSLLAEEDPLLQLETDPLQKDICINLFGEIQMEVIKEVLKSSYQLEVKFSEATTIYKETAIASGRAIINMFTRMNPFAATIGIKIQPTERGRGFNYISEVPTGTLPKSFQNGIEDGIMTAKKEGLLGWEVTDVLVTLIHGAFNSVDSTPADFRNLAPMVFMEALNQCRTELLEPVYSYELRIPKDTAGRTIADLQKMRATLEDQIIIGDDFIIRGLVPIITSKNYKLALASYTSGKGMFLTKFHGYQTDYLKIGKPRIKTMADPLNKKEYLLYSLNAIRK